MEGFVAHVDRKRYSQVSVIIPCKEVDSYTKRCMRHCSIKFPGAEIIVVDDKTCPGYPAGKRNYGMEKAKGSIYAFIDSDAYPSDQWLDKAMIWIETFPAVCGPGVLPPDAPERERVADIVYQMLPYAYRVVPMRQRIIAEYPTFNLIVRKAVATKFEDYLTGEDTLFCRKIKQGIFYHPDILVYHNRRGVFKPLWKQIGTFGRHRGYLIRVALFAWVSSVFVYAVNFIKGLFRRPS